MIPYLLLQAVVGFSLLEVVNYLEHYGLLRQRREDGRYERTRPEHSWNSNSAASNVLLYHLQRHSDHHANPVRRYQALRHVRGGAAAADGLRRDDRPRPASPGVAPGDGPSRPRALPGRRLAGQREPPPERARTSPLRAPRMSRFRCPSCGYVYDEQAGHPREGFPPGTPWSEVPDDWACPDCGVRDKVDFEQERLMAPLRPPHELP